MSEPATSKPPLRVVLCAPRGFCAGVVRAIETVERALRIYGTPVYVRHEIVHNKFVVDSLKAKGVVFINELAEAPPGPHPVVFSAHGVARSVPEEAGRRNLRTIDATCPLVTKVHREALAHFKRGRRIVLIGHAGHPEVVGTMGQLPQGAVTLVSSIEEVERLQREDGQPIAYVTQTTLSVDDTREIVAALRARFPDIHVPPNEDICYATTNRQEAVKAAARLVEAAIVVGAANSSNSQRLREVAEREGCVAQLVADERAVDWAALANVRSVAVTAGASAPETLVERIVEALKERYEVTLETITTTSESMAFPLPRDVRDPV
ncbi:4-hydroxy-3-methylbut-2-enyl diphosphate reductase [Roseiarcus fermentans]|uniref:4-hydroxy-3-methylbut-2-enyl diphosphate reductase n=1 Tax=Roseiarcus fermentans TaxID=1473586 RepID=A0A366FPY7_9HYPH|nr:4-hydroxy-3-methylbut-2-enyl diphosphate reductase [Roseiarcus fermentans]RBP15785.1 4-hydroxy-3-methylbut-2-enyl diphosphate reductase [Roseiarcus fermentans]